MYSQILRECEDTLSQHGFAFLPFTVRTSNHFCSHTLCDGIIWLGAGVRLRHSTTGKGLHHTIIHEMVHHLIHWFPPSYETMSAFGSPTEWDKKQKFSRTLLPRNRNQFVTQYSQTHPEEDLVETATCMLEGRWLTNRKYRMVQRWFNEMKGQTF